MHGSGTLALRTCHYYGGLSSLRYIKLLRLSNDMKTHHENYYLCVLFKTFLQTSTSSLSLSTPWTTPPNAPRDLLNEADLDNAWHRAGNLSAGYFYYQRCVESLHSLYLSYAYRLFVSPLSHYAASLLCCHIFLLSTFSH